MSLYYYSSLYSNSLNTKLRLYTSLAQSVLLHGSETWTLTKADTARLQAFHIKAQRRILNIKWYDFVTNDSVRSQTKLTDLPLIIADRRHSFARTCLPPTTRHTIRYDSVCLTCSKKLTGSHLSLPHGTNKKLKCKTKNKMMSMIGPVQSHYREAVQ